MAAAEPLAVRTVSAAFPDEAALLRDASAQLSQSRARVKALLALCEANEDIPPPPKRRSSAAARARSGHGGNSRSPSRSPRRHKHRRGGAHADAARSDGADGADDEEEGEEEEEEEEGDGAAEEEVLDARRSMGFRPGQRASLSGMEGSRRGGGGGVGGAGALSQELEVLRQASTQAEAAEAAMGFLQAEPSVEVLRAMRSFNLNPRRGTVALRELEEAGGMGGMELPLFLRAAKGLGKTQIGLALGLEENGELLRAYADTFRFAGRTFEGALREFLATFRLPGEAQIVDRIVQAFAQKFHEDNPRTFSSADVVHLLSYAVIMLQTDAHNTQVKNKMSKDDFIRNLRGADNGEDIAREVLVDLYDAITSNPILTTENRDDVVGPLFTNPAHSGWMRKQGGGVGVWQRRYFILSEDTLYYFKNSDDIEPQGYFPLDSVSVWRDSSSGGRDLELRPSGAAKILKSAKFKKGVMVQGRHKQCRLSCNTEDEAAEWLAALSAVVAKLNSQRRALVAQGGQAESALDSVNKNRAASASSAVSARQHPHASHVGILSHQKHRPHSSMASSPTSSNSKGNNDGNDNGSGNDGNGRPTSARSFRDLLRRGSGDAIPEAGNEDGGAEGEGDGSEGGSRRGSRRGSWLAALANKRNRSAGSARESPRSGAPSTTTDAGSAAARARTGSAGAEAATAPRPQGFGSRGSISRTMMNNHQAPGSAAALSSATSNSISVSSARTDDDDGNDVQ